MRPEIRDGKYYLVFFDGEKELTEQEYKAHMGLQMQTIRYANKSIEYTKAGEWAVGNLPKEFDNVVKIDLLIEDMLQAIELNTKQGIQSKDSRLIVDLLISQVDASISNPLKKDQKDLNEYFLKKLKGLLSVLNFEPQQTSNEQQKGKKINIVEQYNTFKSLFKPEYQQNISDFIKILRSTERPVIDDESKYIGGSDTKGVFVVFWDALKAFSIVHTKCSRKVKAALFNINFPGLNISDSLFSQENKRAKILYQHEFEAEISSIKAIVNKKH